MKDLLVGLAALFALAGGVGAGAARAETWPTRPITLIVPYSAGGPTDTLARNIAEPAGGHPPGPSHP